MSTLNIVQANNSLLEEDFSHKIKINCDLNRTLVSFQANKKLPGHRWFKYKEGFSTLLIHYIFQQLGITSGAVIDPFAGVGTTLFVSSKLRWKATGIELLPLGYEIIRVLQDFHNGKLEDAQESIQYWLEEKPWLKEVQIKTISHLKITQGAFPVETEIALGRYLAAIEKEEETIRRLLRFAAICILEEISYTRKDGQYLRWDYRSGRGQGTRKFDKGLIKTFDYAITEKLNEILYDILNRNQILDLQQFYGSEKVNIIHGSCLNILPELEDHQFDCLVTSPP
jgi:hypothetical protein